MVFTFIYHPNLHYDIEEKKRKKKHFFYDYGKNRSTRRAIVELQCEHKTLNGKKKMQVHV